MLAFFLSYLLVYKYAVLFIVIAFASFGFPLPATALIMAAGAFTVQGYFDIHLMLACSFFASVIWDSLGYFISFRYGRLALVRMGLKSLLDSPKFAEIEKLFRRRSRMSIFLSRFLFTSFWPTINLLSWLAKIPFKLFIWFVLPGEFMYVVIFGGLGFVFGDQWKLISSISDDISAILVLLILLVLLVVTLLVGKRGEG